MIKNTLNRIWTILKNTWKSLDYIPDCPRCHGKGKNMPMDLWDTEIWRDGQLTTVCHNYGGTGKV